MEIDKRLETLCEQFEGLKEPEKDYILGISQTLAQSVKGTKPSPAWVERAMSEYKDSVKEN
ncbi:MAG: hypothetical protein FWF55_09985 [Treponema sp.]|nr:hypothetical protein [Treponema sp.]